MERERKQKTLFLPHPEFMRYQMMPKHFVGPETADDLFYISETLLREKPYPSYLYAAGSAAAESGLVGTHLPADERHRRVQRADDLWHLAQEQYLKQHADDGWSEAKLFAFSDRVEGQIIFTNLLHDMINGNVRPETMRSTHERIVRLGMTNLKMFEQAKREGDVGVMGVRRGASFEISTAASVTRLLSPNFFAMFTTARGDDGTHFRDDTHDILIMKQSWGEIRSTLPVEVKPKSGYGRQRYKSALVRGKLHLKMPSAESALHLAVFLDKEMRGKASKQEVKELNEVTSSVLSEAMEYIQRTKLAQQTLTVLRS